MIKVQSIENIELYFQLKLFHIYKQGQKVVHKNVS